MVMAVILVAVREGPSPSLCDNQYAYIVYRSNYISVNNIKISQRNMIGRGRAKALGVRHEPLS
jgi:hypothetical protein